MQYKINTYGCQMNVHESEKIAGILEKMGYTLCTEDLYCDIIVFNTCCIRDTAESKIYGHIGQLKKIKVKNKKLIVIIVGCMSQQDMNAVELFNRFSFINIIMGTHNIEKLEINIKRALAGEKHIIDIQKDSTATIIETEMTRTSFPNAWVNIIYGCNNFCTYCIVPHVRGRERSRQSQDIINEVKDLINKGYKEITLLGQNVNSYGKDLNDSSSFADLLNKIDNIEGKFRIRFMTSHPKDINMEVLEIMSKSSKICNNLHLPIQSGSDKVLKDMNRHYDRAYYLNIVSKARELMPDIGLTTDIMVGFPTESEEDYQDTINLVENVRFSNAFTFVYSKRKGTPAAEMEQVPSIIKKERITKLVRLQNEISSQISKEYIGKVVEILCEDTSGKNNNIVSGRTESGRMTSFKGDSSYIGKFVKVLINYNRGSSLFGDLVTEE